MTAAPEHETFHWSVCVERMTALDAEACFVRDGERRAFVSEELSVAPPLVFPLEPGVDSIASYLDLVPGSPPRQTVILMQAGAVSLGIFEGGECVATKSYKRYVVRGKGRAQPTHLAKKGKSRYGSRLRLQNAQRLLVETNEKLGEWEARFGPSDQVFYSCPVRLWPSLFEARPAPPFERDGPLIRIPRDLGRPTTDILMRAYKALCYGRIERIR